MPACRPRMPTCSSRPVSARLLTMASTPCCAEPAIPSSARERGRVERRHRVRPVAEATAEARPSRPTPTSNHVVGMMNVSTNGRSTPWNTGGSCRSLMIPTGTSSMPARKFEAPGARGSRDTPARAPVRRLLLQPSTTACSSSSSPTNRTRSEKRCDTSSTKRWKSSTPGGPWGPVSVGLL